MVDQLGDYEYNKSADATSLNSASLTGFPAFIRIEQTGDTTGEGVWGIDTSASIDGIEDFGFFDENGNPLDFYAVTVDHTNGVYEFWVRLDLVRDGSTQIEVGYGSGSTDDTSSESSVWDKTNIKHRWSFNESSGDALDSSSNNNDGNVTSGVSQGVAGQIKTAYNFNSDGEEVYVQQSGNIYDTYISLWFKGSNTSTTQHLYATGQDSNNFLNITFSEYWHSAGHIGVFYQQGGDNVRVATNNSYADGNWHHLVVRKVGEQASGIEIYVDGVRDDYTDSDNAISDGAPYDAYGVTDGFNLPGTSRDAPRTFRGDIDEVKYHDGNGFSPEWAQSEYDMSPKAGYSLFSANASETTDQPGTVKESSSSLSIKTNSTLSAKTNPV